VRTPTSFLDLELQEFRLRSLRLAQPETLALG